MSMLLSLAAAAGLSASPPETGWPSVNGDAGAERYSAATAITPDNVGALKRVWTYRTGHARLSSRRGTKFQSTPILVGGKLVLCTPFNAAIALDPATGKELWRRDAQIDRDVAYANDVNCRGVAQWSDPTAPATAPCARRIFMGTNDRRVLAMDLETGEYCAEFGHGGSVTIDPGMDLRWPGEFQITSAPAVVGDVVIVGSAIADNNRRVAPSGVVRAYSARDGKELWRFDPIPRGGDASALGWTGTSPPVEGHANVWAPMSVDAARGLVFLPTSSPSPDFFGGLRPGDNRHANSVVALEASTGALRWAFQTVHHDVWDYDVPAAPILATIAKDGALRDVVIQVTKTGLVFTLDRDTGAPIYPVEERATPQDAAPGETLSATQPFPTAPPSLVSTTLRPQDAYGITPFDRGACRKALSALRYEGVFTPPSIAGTAVFPFTGGGANWGGAAFDPNTNRLFVPVTNLVHRIALVPREKTDEEYHDLPGGEQAPMRGVPYAMQRQVVLSPLGMPCNPPPWGVLHAVDMGTGAIAWSRRLGTTEDLAFGLALKTGTPNAGGPLATKGGVVFIAATLDQYLRAFDSRSGDEIWSARLPAGGQAGPMTYVWKGRQYVVLAAGGHAQAGTKRGDFVVAYALPGPGERAPGLLEKFFSRPGSRLSAVAAAMVCALILFGVFLLSRRRT